MLLKEYRQRADRFICIHLATLAAACAIAVFFPAYAWADLILNAEVRVTAEDNIVGLLSGEPGVSGTTMGPGMTGGSMTGSAAKGFGRGSGSGPGGSSGSYTGSGSQSPGDISVTVMGELGGTIEASERFAFFAKGSAERTTYQQYTEYDQTASGVSAGMTVTTGDILSFRVAVFDRLRRYDNDPDRDSTAYGGAVTVRQRLPRHFRVGQTIERERSSAAYKDFSYLGITTRFDAVYDLTERTVLMAVYGVRSRMYEDTNRTVLRTAISSFSAERRLSFHWDIGLAYDREITKDSVSEAITRNNIATCSLRYSY